MIDKELIEILICPKCKAPVKDAGEFIVCANPACGLQYPVRDGIPAMLIEEALDPKETQKP
jgi:uncharacterized protein YbaR (Trm112 family)